jgi:uncharacterized protein involved in exopolysaccharide biosynthesis
VSALTSDVEPRPVTWADVAASILWARDWIVRAAVVGCTVVAVLTVAAGRTYSSSGAFTLQSRRATSAGLSGLAAQLGVGAALADGAPSPALYADLLRSRSILSGVVQDSVETSAGRRSVLDVLAVPAGTPGARREIGVVLLRQRVSVTLNSRTGLVTFAVADRDPVAAFALATRILSGLESINADLRRTSATAERRFAESRLLESRDALRAAEDGLAAFDARNRQIDADPALQVRRDRLRRDVELRQQVYVTLVQAYEQARLEEQRTTPLLSVIESPVQPALPDPRGLARRVVLAVIGATFVGVLLALARIAVGAPRASDELAARLREVGQDLRSPLATAKRLAFGR